MISFEARELHRDGSVHLASYAFKGNETKGFTLFRAGKVLLELPAGYRLLRTRCCGICSTDLARHLMPFPLPQVTGHEVLAVDSSGRLLAVEINASCTAVGSPRAASCPACSRGLGIHCPERLVLGIDRIPGGFGPWILGPKKNIVPVPPGMPADTAVLVEPFAAALKAVERILRKRELSGKHETPDRIAVLGAGRLGLLVTAALRAVREAMGLSFAILAVEPDPFRAELARRLGADALRSDPGRPQAGGGYASAKVVVEATGRPEGLAAALAMAGEEVHVKSTTGRRTLGLEHLTEMVVDEVSLAPFTKAAVEEAAVEEAARRDRPKGERRKGTALLLGRSFRGGMKKILGEKGFEVHEIPERNRAELRRRVKNQADLVVAGSLGDIDLALRPLPGTERGLVAPTGTILVDPSAGPEGLLEPLLERNLRLTTSRCGDFRKAFPLMQELLEKGTDLGELLVTSRFPAADLAAAMKAARRPGEIKVVVDHPA